MSGLGTTWWHGNIGKRLDSYGPQDAFVLRRNPEKELEAWEATAAWEGKRHALNREASELLRSAGHKVKWDGFLSVDLIESKPPAWTEDEVLLIAILLILMEK